MTADDQDDRFDERLRDAARRGYHAPPPARDVPRDEMWARIAAARAGARGGDGTTPHQAPAIVTDAPQRESLERGSPDPDVIVLPARRWPVALSGGRRPAWARALAAALLVAVGIGVGRMTVSRTGSSSPSSASVATGGSSPALPAPAPTSIVAGREPDSVVAGTTAPTGRGEARDVRVASTTTAAHGDSGTGHRPSAADGDESTAERRLSAAALPYRLAAAEHLALTEALLTTVSADARAGRADSSVSLWARDLLGTTRMLLDSPAAQDPKMARLLEDLELVLAEVAQLRPAQGGANREDLQAIDRAVRQRGVLTRLRASSSGTTPAGPLTAGT